MKLPPGVAAPGPARGWTSSNPSILQRKGAKSPPSILSYQTWVWKNHLSFHFLFKGLFLLGYNLLGSQPKWS